MNPNQPLPPAPFVWQPPVLQPPANLPPAPNNSLPAPAPIPGTTQPVSARWGNDDPPNMRVGAYNVLNPNSHPHLQTQTNAQEISSRNCTVEPASALPVVLTNVKTGCELPMFVHLRRLALVEATYGRMTVSGSRSIVWAENLAKKRDDRYLLPLLSLLPAEVKRFSAPAGQMMAIIFKT